MISITETLNALEEEKAAKLRRPIPDGPIDRNIGRVSKDEVNEIIEEYRLYRFGLATKGTKFNSSWIVSYDDLVEIV